MNFALSRRLYLRRINYINSYKIKLLFQTLTMFIIAMGNHRNISQFQITQVDNRFKN